MNLHNYLNTPNWSEAMSHFLIKFEGRIWNYEKFTQLDGETDSSSNSKLLYHTDQTSLIQIL